MHNTTAGSHMACNIPVCILCTYVIVYMNVYMCVLEHGYIENIYRYTLLNTYAHTHTHLHFCVHSLRHLRLYVHTQTYLYVYLSVCTFVLTC